MSLASDLLHCAERFGIVILQHPFICAVTALLGWYVVYQRYFHPLRRIPGPFFASLSVFWRVSNVLSFQQTLHDYEMHKKHGPVFRDGPNSVSVSDPRALEPIYGLKTDLRKAEWYWVMEPDNSGEDYSVFSSRNAEQHQRLRKRIARTYSMTTVMNYEPIIDRNINDLLAWFKKLGTLDISVWIHYFTMDAMSEMAYGDRMGFLVKGTDVNRYRKSLHPKAPFASETTTNVGAMATMLKESVPILIIMGFFTTLNHIMKSRWLNPYIGPSPKDKYGYGHMIGMTERLADEILLHGNLSGKKTMSHDLSQCRNDDGTPLSRKELVGEMLAFTTAGSDPAAFAITMTLNNICRYPSVRDKLLMELKEAGKLESSTAGVVTYAQTTRLDYLHAVVKETMRHSPPFQGNFPRVSPSPGGLQVLPGVYIPPGVDMSMNSYISHRDQSIFGNDADEFVPERWLPIGGERYRLMARHLASFGYGSAQCMGQNIAMLKINKCIVEILRRFDSNLVDPKAPLQERNIHQMFISNLFVTFTEREKKLGV